MLNFLGCFTVLQLTIHYENRPIQYTENFTTKKKHTCHTSHCEIKSHRILAHLEGNSHKKFKSHRIFSPFYNRFYEEININHSLLWLSQASYMKKKRL